MCACGVDIEAILSNKLVETYLVILVVTAVIIAMDLWYMNEYNSIIPLCVIDTSALDFSYPVCLNHENVF